MPNESSADVAKAFFEAILKQSELLGSWSLAVFGACVLLTVWYAQRRLDHANHPALRALYLVFACALLQGLSILLWYMAYGQLVNVILVVQFAKYQTTQQFLDVLAKTDFELARLLFVCQFATAFAGIVLLGLFALLNHRLVRRNPA
jgi:hypothetical protein